jgi:glycolate oxidase
MLARAVHRDVVAGIGVTHDTGRGIVGQDPFEPAIGGWFFVHCAHGIGVEKRDYMPLVFDHDDLQAQACVRLAFDPGGRMNPDKVLPTGTRCGEVGLADSQVPEGTWI